MTGLAVSVHIETTEGIRSGKPCLVGTRMTVADVVTMHLRLGQSLEEIAGTYGLSLASVYAAMSYYHDHREAIDRSIDEARAYADSMAERTPSKLAAKLAGERG
ncbi:MAG: DUF433 domain-containing protein [Acidobacteriota bacterium]